MLFRSIFVTPPLFGCASTHLLLFCQKIIWLVQCQEDHLQHTNCFRQAAQTDRLAACAPQSIYSAVKCWVRSHSFLFANMCLIPRSPHEQKTEAPRGSA